MTCNRSTRWIGLAMVLALLGAAGAQSAGSRKELSAEQRQEMRQLREQLQEQGADRGTCRIEHDKLLRSWGIEPSELPPPGGRGCGRGMRGPHGLGAQLSPEQREQMRELHQRLLEQDASPEAIREACDNQLKEWGVERPANCPPDGPGWNGPRGPGHGPLGLGAQLTTQQHKQLRKLHRKLRAADASPETIRIESDRLLAEWGVQPPPGCPGDGPRRDSSCRRGPRFCHPGAGGVVKESGAESREARPVGKILKGNHPNPFNPETVISYELPESGNVVLSVFNLEGGLVRRLQEGVQSAGTHRVTWLGDTDSGQPAASGTYLYRLDWLGGSETGRMTLLR